MAVISGTKGDSATILSESFDAVESEKDPKKKDINVKLYKLLLALNSFDLQLMQSSVTASKKEKVLDIKKVSDEIQMLQAFCGKEDKYALVSIDWESEYTFANGYRSPPWRQLYGEICYIEVKAHDKDKFIITASKNGFFVNKGYILNEKGIEILNYDKVSSDYPTITDLLKAQSAHFAEKIDKQIYIYQKHDTGNYLTTDLIGR